MRIDDRELKQAALAGLRHERQRMDELIARLERELGTGAVIAAAAGPARARRKRHLSAAGRANIIAALKKRWAGVKKAKAATAKRKGAAKASASKAAEKKAAAPARKAKRVVKAAGRKPGTEATARSRKRAAPAKAVSKQAAPPAVVAEAPETPVN